MNCENRIQCIRFISFIKTQKIDIIKNAICLTLNTYYVCVISLFKTGNK